MRGIEPVLREKPPHSLQQPLEKGAKAALLACVGDPGPGRGRWWAVSLRVPFTPPSICFPYLVPVEMLRKSTQCHFRESIISKAFSRRGLKILNHPPTSPTHREPTGRVLGEGWVMLLPQQHWSAGHVCLPRGNFQGGDTLILDLRAEPRVGSSWWGFLLPQHKMAMLT